MNCPPSRPAGKAFFLDTDWGKRHCLYYAPSSTGACRGSVVYVPPFAEEMNRTRRLAAQQARSLSALGYGVLQVDLYGCGDSDGEFRDACWEVWKKDLDLAATWLEKHVGGRTALWGVRLGSLLALDLARAFPGRFGTMVFWQPVLSGKAYLTQFLRLHLAADMLSANAGERLDLPALRASLASGNTLEIAGYELSPRLASAIEQSEASNLISPDMHVHWLELTPNGSTSIAAPRNKAADDLIKAGADLHLHAVPGAQFWLSQDLFDCPSLTAATERIFVEDAR